jgi:hypothetical protein
VTLPGPVIVCLVVETEPGIVYWYCGTSTCVVVSDLFRQESRRVKRPRLAGSGRLVTVGEADPQVLITGGVVDTRVLVTDGVVELQAAGAPVCVGYTCVMLGVIVGSECSLAGGTV